MKVERGRLDQAKQALQQQVLDMGRQTCETLREVSDAFDHVDRGRAERIVARDPLFNQLNEKIHEACVELIARQQPVASELREILSEMEIALELERIADHAADIARIVCALAPDQPLPPAWSEILNMASRSREMLDRMLTAYRERDAVTAEVIAATDDDLDRLNHQIVNEVIDFMRASPGAVANGTKLIWITHNLERIGDRITNIGEHVLFIATGRKRDLNRSRW